MMMVYMSLWTMIECLIRLRNLSLTIKILDNMNKKEFIKNQIQNLIDLVNEKGNTMTIADIANVNGSIDTICLKLEDSEEDFPNKNDVIEYLKDLRFSIRKSPYYNLVSNILFGLNGVMCFLR